MITAFPIGKIDPNPRPARFTDEPDHIAGLAEELEAGRVLPVPYARRHPTDASRAQLAFGHSRLKAWTMVHPGEPFEVDVRELSDEQMAEYALAENAKRRDANPIDKAHALATYIKDFHKTQAQAGKLVGLEDQASVAKLLSLLELPPRLQDLVATHALPQRFAWMLSTAAKYWPDRAVNAGAVIAKESEGNREREAQQQLSQIWRALAIDLTRLPWDESWKPEAGMYADIRAAHPEWGVPAEPRACKGCPDRHTYDRTKYCALKACYEVKCQVQASLAAAKASKKLQVPVAAADEKAVPIFERIGWQEQRDAERLVARKPEGLRLIPLVPKRNERYEVDYTGEVTGSPLVTLAAVDPKAVLELLKSPAAKTEKPKNPDPGLSGRGESGAAKAKRLKDEKAEEIARRKERAANNRAKWETLWLFEHAAKLIAERLTVKPSGFVAFVEEVFTNRYSIYQQYPEVNGHARALEERVEQASGTERDRMAIEHLAYAVLVHNCHGMVRASDNYDFDGTRDAIKGACHGDKEAKFDDLGFGIELPAGWDRPPILKTEFNCRQCARFAPGEKITQKDKADGWLVVYEMNAKGHPSDSIAGVYCPDHRESAAVSVIPPEPSKTLRKSETVRHVTKPRRRK